MNIEKTKIAVIGQGYVGLPLAIEFGKKYITVGYDINKRRIEDLKKGVDYTNEASPTILNSKHLNFSSVINDILECNVYIVTVFTQSMSLTRQIEPFKRGHKNDWNKK